MSVETSDGATIAKSQINEITSPHWANIFKNPYEIKDTDEYEYTEIEEVTSGGSIPAANQPRFTFYNRDVDSYHYWRKGYVRVLGKLALHNDRNAITNGSGYVNNVALQNLGQFCKFKQAYLKIENNQVDYNENPGKITLVKCLNGLSKENKEQAEVFFFYKTTGKNYNVATGNRSYAYDDDIIIPYKSIIKQTGAASTNATTADLAFLVDNDNYNKGMKERRDVCLSTANNTQKEIELYIPLALLFDFYDSHDFPFRGMKHEITLDHEPDKNKYIQRGRNLNNADSHPFISPSTELDFFIDKISLWVPRLKPSLQKTLELDTFLSSGEQMSLAWKQYNYYTSSQYPGNAGSHSWRITGTASRVTRVYIFFQNSHRFNMSTGDMTHLDYQKFDLPPITTISLNYNGHQYPNFPINVKASQKLVTDQVHLKRLYQMYVENNRKLLPQDHDKGILLSYEDFVFNYPLICFDLTNVEPRVYENVSSSEITVSWQTDAENLFPNTFVARAGAGLAQSLHYTSGVTPYYCCAVVESDKQALLKGISGKMVVTL